MSQLSRSLPLIPDDRIYHSVPTFGREHVTNKRGECWCQPHIEVIEGGATIFHKAEQ